MSQEREIYLEKDGTQRGNTKETIIQLLLMLSPSVLSRIEKPKAGEELITYRILRTFCSLFKQAPDR